MTASNLRSYTIWSTQRTGSTWLCDMLTSTGVAGRPVELFQAPEPGALLRQPGVATVGALREVLWRLGGTPNGVFGLKHGFSEPHFGELIRLLHALRGEADGVPCRHAVWEATFPDQRHVVMTRRNKVRLAVSWWRAVKSGEWQRRAGTHPTLIDLRDDYDFRAIDQLLAEAVMREAGIQEFLAEGRVTPLTVVYEDLAREPREVLRSVLRFLKLPEDAASLVETDRLERQADATSEAWVQRFRRDKQAGWRNLGW